MKEKRRKMKKAFIPVRIEISKEKIREIIKEKAKKLPEKIGLIGIVNHEHDFDSVKKFLEGVGKKVTVGGVVLGCNFENAKRISGKVDAFVYFGSGEFHPIGIALSTEKDVFVLNPLSGTFEMLSKESVEEVKKRRIVAIKRFYASDVVGIITSIKPGQCRIEEAEKMKEKIEAMGKKAYLFIGDEISEIEKENFPFIQSWINCACPRLSDFRSDMVNLADLERQD